MAKPRRNVWLGAAGLAVWLAVLPGAPLAERERPARGVVSAKAFAGLPKGTPVAVRPLGDTVLNRHLRPHVVRQLEARGYRVQADAAHVLSYETEVTSKTSQPGSLSLSGHGGDHGLQRLNLQLTLPSAKDDSRRRGTRYRLNMTLRRDSEPPMWMGSALARLRQGDWLRVQSVMATELIALIGRTAENRPLNFQ